MMLRLIIIIFAFSSFCANAQDFSFGHAMQAAHKISLYALLGDSQWYDGEPISVIGVAHFDFRFETASGLYASRDDLENETYSWVALELPAEKNLSFKNFLSLNKKYIRVDGIYHAYERESLKDTLAADSSAVIICRGICGASGYIEVKYVGSQK